MGHCLWKVRGKVRIHFPFFFLSTNFSWRNLLIYLSFLFTCRQNKLEEALLFSGQFTDALQALIDWLYKVEPQLAEEQPVHGDIDLVLNLIDNHKVETAHQKYTI